MKTLREQSRSTLLMALLMCCLLLPVSGVAAETSMDEKLAEEGLTVLALRNDTIDTDQDGDIDVRAGHRSESHGNLERTYRSIARPSQGARRFETQEIAFQGQTNITLVYDAWSKGEHNFRLDFFDEDGDFIASYPLPTFMFTPALQVPKVELTSMQAGTLQTGEACEIVRNFGDETGPRYGQTGVRTFTGAPFSVLDSDETLDCSSWPAGSYELKETYRNGLGQTAESTLNFTIQNRPAPVFFSKRRVIKTRRTPPATLPWCSKTDARRTVS